MRGGIAPQAEMRQAQGKGRLKTPARRQRRRTRLLFLCPALSPPFPADDMRLPRRTFSATERKKLPEKGAFFMRCRFRTKRSQQNRAGGMEGILPVARRPPPAYQRPWRGLASADNTRWGWKGWKKRSSSRAGSDCMAAKGHSRGNEGSCGQRRQQRKLPLLPGYATQAVSFRRATMPRRASSATTFSTKTGSMASASGERPTCMVRQSKG